MIRNITINDEEIYNHLGNLLNNDFTSLFDLKKELDNKYNKIYVYELNNKVIGFIHILISFNSADIINIVINEDYRNNGYGKELIDYAIKDNDLKELNIEVRKSNKAVNFYLNNDFKIIREIPNYYQNEDAYFMKKVI